MKAQFATFEALAAAFVITLAMASGSAIIGSYASRQYYSSEHLRLVLAEHDFVESSLVNYSLDSCILSYVQNRSSCMGYYSSYFSKLYGLGQFNISAPGNFTTGESCFPVLNSTRLLCFGD